MTAEAQLVFAILGVAIVLFVSGRVRLDITSFLIVLALMLSGVLTVKEAVSGFGDPIILTLAGLFVVGEALIQTGVAYRVGDRLLKIGGTSEIRLVVLLMVVAALLGSVMSSTGVVAIFIPIVLRIASETGRSPARFLMPVSYGALISGMLTLIATPPNLVVNGALRDAGAEVFGLFSFAPVGLIVLVTAILYMVFVGMRLLGGSESSARESKPEVSLEDLAARYGIAGRIHRVLIRADSALIGKSVVEADVGDTWNVYVLAVQRQERVVKTVIPMNPNVRFRVGDALLVDARPSDLLQFLSDCQLEELPISAADSNRFRETFGAAEILIPPESQYLDESIQTVELRTRYGVTVLGMRRKGENFDGDRTAEPLQAGDMLLVAGDWKQVRRLQSNPRNLILLSVPSDIKHAVSMSSHAPIAVLVLVLMVVLLVLEIIPMLATILLAGLVLVGTGCLTMDRAYQSIHWSTLVLVAGLLPIALALDKTGGMQLIAQELLSSVGAMGPYTVLTVVFFLTAGLSMFLSNTATSVLVAPLAVRMALDLGYEPRAFAVMVVMGASAAFVTPISTSVVSLIVAPGNYRFIDFVKVGLPLLFVVWLVSLAITPLLFPL